MCTLPSLDKHTSSTVAEASHTHIEVNGRFIYASMHVLLQVQVSTKGQLGSNYCVGYIIQAEQVYQGKWLM